MDARVACVLDCLPRAVDVGVHGAGEGGDLRALDVFGDRAHGFEIADRGGREATLDDVDLEPGELLGDLELLFGVEGDAGRLLAVPEGRIEDENLVHRGTPFLTEGGLGRPPLSPSSAGAGKDESLPRQPHGIPAYETNEGRVG